MRFLGKREQHVFCDGGSTNEQGRRSELATLGSTGHKYNYLRYTSTREQHH